MLADPGTEPVAAGHDVEDTRGQGALEHLPHRQARERGEGGGLQHDAVPGEQGRSDLPHRQEDGEVPGRDRSHHAEGLPAQLDPLLVVLVELLGGDLEPGREAEPHCCALDLLPGLGQRLALLARQHGPDLLGGGSEGIRARDQGLAPARLVRRPGCEGAPGRLHRGLELLATAVRRLGEGLARRGVDDREGGRGRDGATVDRQAEVRHAGLLWMRRLDVAETAFEHSRNPAALTGSLAGDAVLLLWPVPKPPRERPSMSDEDLREELDRLRAENEALKAKETRALRLQVSEKKGVSLYGIRRFPVTFYADEWEKILGMSDEIRAFIGEHGAELKRK
jgi:hypothetical protein